VEKVYTRLSKEQLESLDELQRAARLASRSEALRFAVAFTSALLGTRVKLLSPDAVGEAVGKAWAEVMKERRRGQPSP